MLAIIYGPVGQLSTLPDTEEQETSLPIPGGGYSDMELGSSGSCDSWPSSSQAVMAAAPADITDHDPSVMSERA